MHEVQPRLEVQLQAMGQGHILRHPPILEPLHQLDLIKKPALALADVSINSAQSALDVLPGYFGTSSCLFAIWLGILPERFLRNLPRVVFLSAFVGVRNTSRERLTIVAKPVSWKL